MTTEGYVAQLLSDVASATENVDWPYRERESDIWSWMSDDEEDPEYDGSDLPEWQRESIELASAMLEDDGSRFIDPPSRERHDAFQDMEEFAHHWPDRALSEHLLKQLCGRGSFRRFREAVDEHRIRDEWCTAQNQKQKASLIAWCRENNVEYEDDMVTEPRRLATSGREHLLKAAGWFVREASKLEEVERIALIGSLCADQERPKDLDLLVTVKPGASVDTVATLIRKLQGRISRGSLGADVFIADGPRYAGRACHYREPWLRRACAEKRLCCAEGRLFLCNTSGNFSLGQDVIDDPPVVLWPDAACAVGAPDDVRALVESVR